MASPVIWVLILMIFDPEPRSSGVQGTTCALFHSPSDFENFSCVTYSIWQVVSRPSGLTFSRRVALLVSALGGRSTRSTIGSVENCAAGPTALLTELVAITR